jgi:hypothetical protein
MFLSRTTLLILAPSAVAALLLLVCASDRPAAPRVSSFAAADERLLAGEAGSGDTPDARALAFALRERLGPLAHRQVLAHAQATPDAVCFLVYVPSLELGPLEDPQALLDLAWQAARHVTSERVGGAGAVAVALRGASGYVGYAEGRVDQVAPAYRGYAADLIETRLRPFFPQQATAAAPITPR